jgi:hypothetical protein
MSLISQLLATLCVGVCANPAASPRSEPEKKGDTERVALAIAFLDTEDWRIDQLREALGGLTQLAASDRKAQSATVRYLERASSHRIHMPLFHARLLSQYDAGFARAVTASLTTTEEPQLCKLWLVTLALMGKKANAQVESLTEYVRRQRDPVKNVLARIVLTEIGAAPTDNNKVIETEILKRTEAGRAAVRMAALIGFRNWATQQSISAVHRWLTEVTEDISQADRCWAAMALAVSGRRDEVVKRRIRELLAEAMNDDGSSERICYAYALAILDSDRTDHYWRVILKKLGSLYNHTDGSAILDVCVSIPVKHIAIVNLTVSTTSVD